MSTDKYTKSVLTVIAVSLVWICVRDITFIESSFAQSRGTVLDVRIVGVSGSTTFWPSIPVQIK